MREFVKRCLYRLSKAWIEYSFFLLNQFFIILTVTTEITRVKLVPIPNAGQNTDNQV